MSPCSLTVVESVDSDVPTTFATAAPVPLPAAGSLLLVGLLSAAGLGYRRERTA